jgi:hypothetical protein
MENEILLIAFRGAERIAAVVLAGLLIYFGYKLFLHLPDKTDSEGKVVLPGGVSIYITRIGPGAFLALFGAVILIYSVTTQIEIKSPYNHPTTTNIKSDSTYKNNIYSVKFDRDTARLKKINQEILDYENVHLQMDFQTLNQLYSIVDDMIKKGTNGNIDFNLATNLNTGIVRLKGMIMLRHWKDGWGNSTVFFNWVKNGAKEDVPPEISNAVKFFNSI